MPKINEVTPQDYEMACLEEARKVFGNPRGLDLILRSSGKQVDGVELEGQYPNTRLVVHYLNTRKNRREQWEIHLWEAYPEVRELGYLQDPDFVANDLFDAVMEP